MFSKKVIDVLSLIRVKNLMVLMFSQAFIFFVLLDENVTVQFFFLMFSTVTATMSGNVINDIVDVKADAVNLPSKQMNQKFSSSFLYTLVVLGVVLSVVSSFWLSTTGMWLVVVNNILLILYSFYLKKMPFIGNLVVALLSSSSVYLFYLVFETHQVELIVFSVFVFFIHLIREVTKDIEDIKGDEVAGYNTLPLVIGVKETKKLVLLLQVAFVVVLCMLSIKITTSLWFYNMLVIVPFVLFLGYKTINAKEKKVYTSISNWYKVLMLLGIFGMLFC